MCSKFMPYSPKIAVGTTAIAAAKLGAPTALSAIGMPRDGLDRAAGRGVRAVADDGDDAHRQIEREQDIGEVDAHALRRLIAAHPVAQAADVGADHLSRRVQQAAAAGQHVVFGDATRLQSLMAAGPSRANAVVITWPSRSS